MLRYGADQGVRTVWSAPENRRWPTWLFTRRYYGFQSNWTNEEIQRELAELIRSLKDPRVQTMISITRVDTTPDLRYSKIYVSVLEEARSQDALRGLKSAGGWLRRELGSRLQLRYTPELVFTLDDSLKYGAHMFDLLEKLERQEAAREAEKANDEG